MKTYSLTQHAGERIRLRFGIESRQVAEQWANEKIASADHVETQDKKQGKRLYRNGDIEVIVSDRNMTIITVQHADSVNEYLTKLNGVVTKEVTKLKTEIARKYRKAEINVAEITLNYLKARNPKTRDLIQAKLTAAIDEKLRLEDELKKIKRSAEHYGVELDLAE